MATVIIRNEKNEGIIDTKIVKISPLGFECEITADVIGSLRDRSGRLLTLDCEIYLETSGKPVCILGSVSVGSIRRVSQSVSLLKTRFNSLEEGALQYIREYIEHGKVVSVSLNHSAAKRRA